MWMSSRARGYKIFIMHIYPYKLRVLTPPKDDLKEAIRASKLSLREGDIIAISSKVVSIGEGGLRADGRRR